MQKETSWTTHKEMVWLLVCSLRALFGDLDSVMVEAVQLLWKNP